MAFIMRCRPFAQGLGVTACVVIKRNGNDTKAGSVYCEKGAKLRRNSSPGEYINRYTHRRRVCFAQTRIVCRAWRTAFSFAREIPPTRRIRAMNFSVSRDRSPNGPACSFLHFSVRCGKKDRAQERRYVHIPLLVASSTCIVSLARSLVLFPRPSWPTFTRLPSPLCSLHTSRDCNLRLTERKPKGSDRVVTRSVHIGSVNEETCRRERLSLS